MLDASTRRYSFRACTCLGIPVYVHIYMFFLVGLQVAQTLASVGLNSTGFTVGAWTFLLYGPILFGTVLVHELGHCAAARCVGGRAEEILLWPLGGLAYVAHSTAPCDDLKVAIAGPLTHIPMAAVCLGLQSLTGPPTIFMDQDLTQMEDLALSLNLLPNLKPNGGLSEGPLHGGTHAAGPDLTPPCSPPVHHTYNHLP